MSQFTLEEINKDIDALIAENDSLRYQNTVLKKAWELFDETRRVNGFSDATASQNWIKWAIESIKGKNGTII